jgi:anti-anti-sigma factor
MSSERAWAWIEWEDAGGVTVVRFRAMPFLSEPSYEAVRAELLALVTELGRRKVVLDLDGVSSLNSVSLAVLLAVYKQAEAAGGTVILARPCEQARTDLHTVGFNHLFPVTATVDEAVSILGRWPGRPASRP